MNTAWLTMKQVPEEQYKVISVERLVSTPYIVQDDVMDFFEFDHDDTSLRQMTAEVNPDKAHIGRWRDELKPAQAQAVDHFCGDTHRLWRMVEKYGGRV